MILRASFVIWGSNPSGYRFAYPTTKPSKLRALEPELKKIEGIRFALPKSNESAVFVGMEEGSNYTRIIGSLKRIFNPLLPYTITVLFVEIQRCNTGLHSKQGINAEFVPGFEPKDHVKVELYKAVGQLNVNRLIPVGARTERDLQPYKEAVAALKQRHLTHIQEIDIDLSFCCN